MNDEEWEELTAPLNLTDALSEYDIETLIKFGGLPENWRDVVIFERIEDS